MPETDQVLTWILVGGLAGAAAGSLMARRRLYLHELVIAGLLGAFVGGFIIEAAGVDLPDASFTITLGDLITAFVGAAVLIFLAEIIVGARRG
jgi:uncharacterized membrane protein YeaQ/YmgE (transglycosylase-associated protein family)